MSNPQIEVYPSGQEAAAALGRQIASLVQNQETYNIALSGGSTPKILFSFLIENYKKLDWSAVHFYWGDERCVPPDHEESNFKMANDLLLSKINIPSENIHRVKGENDPAAEARRYSAVVADHLPEVNGYPEFDMILLGLGDDGHTASIFPHQMRLLDSTEICEVAQHPVTGQNRITLTGHCINSAKTVAFLVTGKNKADKINSILSNDHKAINYPASHIRPNHGELIWYLDRAAADGLSF